MLISIFVLKYYRKGLMSFEQYWNIASIIEKSKGCNILIFGLGYDSILWKKINSNGKNVYIEDDVEWIRKFENKNLDIRMVEYSTLIEQDHDINPDNIKLILKIDNDIKKTKWDIIIVDAPLGHQPPRKWSGPGRMSSLYMTKKLKNKKTIVIVDDYNRKVENKFCEYYFGHLNKRIIQKKLVIFNDK